MLTGACKWWSTARLNNWVQHWKPYRSCCQSEWCDRGKRSWSNDDWCQSSWVWYALTTSHLLTGSYCLLLLVISSNFEDQWAEAYVAWTLCVKFLPFAVVFKWIYQLLNYYAFFNEMLCMNCFKNCPSSAENCEQKHNCIICYLSTFVMSWV